MGVNELCLSTSRVSHGRVSASYALCHLFRNRRPALNGGPVRSHGSTALHATSEYLKKRLSMAW